MAFLNRRAATALCTGFSITVPSALWAQAQPVTTPVTEVNLDVIGTYDSNVARSSAAAAALRGLDRADSTISPTLSITLARPMGENSLRLAAQLGYNFHARNTQLNRERILVNLDAVAGLGPCRLAPSIGFQRRQSDLGDIAFLSANPLATVKNTETVQTYAADLACGQSPGIEPVGGVRYEKATNSNILRDRAEYTSLAFHGGLRYTSDALGQVTLFGSHRTVDLPNIALVGGGEDGYRVNEYGLRYRRDLGTRVQASGMLAYSDLRIRSGASGAQKGVVWNAELTALVGARLRLTASAGREIANSLASDAAFAVTKPYRLRFEYAASELLRFDGGVAITQRRFNYDFVPTGNVVTSETRRTYDVGASYQYGRRIRLRLFAAHEQRSANDSFFNYHANSVGASVGIRF